MAGKLSVFAKRIFIFFNLGTAFIFLLACLAPYLNPSKWWLLSFLGIGFPIILAVLILFFLFWLLLLKPRYALISLIAMLIGWKSISVFFAFNATEQFSYKKPKGVVRILSWNVARFVEWSRNNNEGSQKRLKMMDLIKKQNADILCLQEFFHSTDSVYYDNLNHVMKRLGYPYFYYSWDDDGWKQWVGQVIFSRFPIIDSGMIRYPRPGMPESLIHADIVANTDTFRVYNTHLQSFRFQKDDYERIEKIKNREDSLIENSRSLFSKMKRAMILRSQQAKIVKNVIGNSPHPYILSGDLNDVPTSYTYFTIRDGLQDAFLEKEFGIGRTYNSLSPTLRIDYILATKHFSILQFDRKVEDLSDHYMLVTDVQLKK